MVIYVYVCTILVMGDCGNANLNRNNFLLTLLSVTYGNGANDDDDDDDDNVC
jgi:hypothetical protein